MRGKSSKLKKVSPGAALEEPTTQTSETKVSEAFFLSKLPETLAQLNAIFDKHHRKYKNRIEWRKAIIEELAGWKLGISAHKES
jgi:hypothetical protein